MGFTSVGVRSASISETSESLRGVNPPKGGELTSNWVRDLCRGRRVPVCKVSMGRAALV